MSRQSLNLFLLKRREQITYINITVKMSTTTTTTIASEPITAQSIIRLFPDIVTSSTSLEGHDEEQIKLMDEICIVIDNDDKPIGNLSKKICKI